MKYYYISFFAFIITACNFTNQKELKSITNNQDKSQGVFVNMNNTTLDGLIRKMADQVVPTSQFGYWEFVVNDKKLFCITDVRANRMRVISPIISIDKIEVKHLQDAMAANFHSALDARYAVSDGYVWSAFIHPLQELTNEQFKAAVSQVVNANENFGSTYQSSDLFFGGTQKEKSEKL